MKFIKMLLNSFFLCLFKLYISFRQSKNLKSTINSGNYTYNNSLDLKHVHNQNKSLGNKIEFYKNKTHDTAYKAHNESLTFENLTKLKNYNHNNSNDSHLEKTTHQTIKEINKTSFLPKATNLHHETNKSYHETYENNSKAIKHNQNAQTNNGFINITSKNYSDSIAADHPNSKNIHNNTDGFTNKTYDFYNKISNHTLNAINISIHSHSFKPNKTKNENKTIDNNNNNNNNNISKKEDDNHEVIETLKHNYSNPINLSKHSPEDNHTITVIIHVLKNYMNQTHNDFYLKPQIKTNNSIPNQEKKLDNIKNKTILKENITHPVSEEVKNETVTVATETDIIKSINNTHKDDSKAAVISPKIIINKINDVVDQAPKSKDETSNIIKGEEKELSDNSLNDIGKKDESEISEDIFSFPTITRLLARFLM